jgi:hypothetical protein
MNLIGKHLNLIGILLLTVVIGAAAGLYFDVPARLQHAMAKSVAGEQYTCPMHHDVVSAKLGNCPKCGMALVSASEAKTGHAQCGDNGELHPGCCAGNVGQASSLPVDGASLPRDSGGRMPPESADKMSAPHWLPPGHPPIPGWPTNVTPGSAPALPNAPADSPH